MKALNTYFDLLKTLPQTASQAASAFVYAYSEFDRTYGPPLYPEPGTFNKTTTPWLNDIRTVPQDQLWTQEDIDFRELRGAEFKINSDLAKEKVPQQTYSGSVIDQVQQRFSKGFFNESDTFPSFPNFPSVPAMVEHWIGDDAEFARQRLGADNPDVISLFPGSSDNLDTILKAGSGAKEMTALSNQLHTALEQGNLFICDYRPILGEVTAIRSGQFLTVPIVFFVSDGKALLPAAIQLRRQEYWFTPADAANAWLLAKLHTASADAQWWFSGTHLFNTHSIDMIFGIAAYVSGLPTTHPIYMLLDPHMKKVYSINTAVYNAAYDPQNGDTTQKPGIYQKPREGTGVVDELLPTGRIGLYQLVNALYQDYNFEKEAFPNNMKNRGMDTFKGSFPYRDDGQVWWDTLESFTSDIVEATYATDADVAKDQLLVDWLNTVEAAFNHDGTIRFPTFNKTKDQLKAMMTNLSYMTTTQHTAVNNTMFDGLAFVPNGAFAMTKAAPANAGNITDQDVYDSLPNPQDDNGINVTLSQIGFVMAGTATVLYLASCDIDASVDCLHKMYPYASGTKQYNAVAKFSDALRNTAAQKLQQNQDARVAAFKTQCPNAQTVPNSVTYDYLSIKKVMACIQI